MRCGLKPAGDLTTLRRPRSSRRPSPVALLQTLVGALIATASGEDAPDTGTGVLLQEEEQPAAREEGQRVDRVEKKPAVRGAERSAAQVEDHPTAPVDEQSDGSVETEPIEQGEDSTPYGPPPSRSPHALYNPSGLNIRAGPQAKD